MKIDYIYSHFFSNYRHDISLLKNLKKIMEK